jgi:hypothetical protein
MFLQDNRHYKSWSRSTAGAFLSVARESALIIEVGTTPIQPNELRQQKIRERKQGTKQKFESSI